METKTLRLTGSKIILDEMGISSEKTHQFSRELNNFIAGGVAGMIAKTMVAPIERVKLLQQLSHSSTERYLCKEISYENLSAWDTTIRVYRQEGLLAFWRGEKYYVRCRKT